ncbi:lipoprotein ABC transporter ATP-binding protein [Neisseria elongata subsp. glycolytica ATCC 29315]|uniref:Lipoprotein-releasing system ATP-binding protein LolD n=1 Tax=Neisseria elongata subsp. glycolytica ATCC 29315 TaxID=546263 RepID=D4DVC5_NEIEG|nr:lipoprotein-releasing ABC transporter ATP-binding protein LolD [Neisseria elongata]AJE18902.1 lipoprotein ABC transporter ATP-binding protein [Neisseria elongata subsp. glycolytica ATCC 29315]EFE48208.1 lipoprotein releasing system, ATP-binding protein [Neisseria elongata subsp. glycolytica ATCC 29315]SQH50799.1 putative lipoprotein releasing factor ATP-binding protein [Neisseria elongata subsp. glycolytica]
MSNIILACEAVCKNYYDGQLNVQVLDNLTLQVDKGQSIGIVGASGSGKSTLLHILGGLDKPTSGRVSLMGQDLSQLSQKQLSGLRNQYLGFVYQFHHLLPEFSALENVMMPLLIGKLPKEQARERALLMLEKVGLKDRVLHRPGELSGGERQRAAIARALVTDPACLLADEPTGNLDRKNALNILDMMMELKQELGTALVVVTHDDEMAARFDRVLNMTDGALSD